MARTKDLEFIDHCHGACCIAPQLRKFHRGRSACRLVPQSWIGVRCCFVASLNTLWGAVTKREKKNRVGLAWPKKRERLEGEWLDKEQETKTSLSLDSRTKTDDTTKASDATHTAITFALSTWKCWSWRCGWFYRFYFCLSFSCNRCRPSPSSSCVFLWSFVSELKLEANHTSCHFDQPPNKRAFFLIRS